MLATGIVAIGAAALILALAPSFVAVLFAEFLHGVTGGIITPAIGAISLGLVGRSAMSLRTGRNFRYAAGGNALTAAVMGLVGAYYAESGIFLAAAGLCIPIFSRTIRSFCSPPRWCCFSLPMHRCCR